ncbi:MAG: SDR family NAD(P)-dependent oxidoreductase [Sumerlaeia bacterium]
MKRSEYFHERVIWITGASSGIGAACARLFAKEGARIALSARSGDKLAQLADEIGGGDCLVLPFDVTDREANHRAVAAIRERFGGLDTAFFNAGTWKPMDLPHFDPRDFDKTFQVNVMGMVNGIEAALPELEKSERGHLVGMSSSVAYRGIPRAEAYCASKAATRALLQALRCQLKPRGVPVSIVLPGFVKSPLTETNDFDMPFLMETEDAARKIAIGMARYRGEIAFPWQMIAIFRLLALLPDSLYTSMMAKKVVRG